MKTSIYLKSFLALATACSLTACDENAWNDHLDGFEDKDDLPIANVQTIEYTLTDADYAAIASNATNKALAGEDGAKALAAVSTRKAFSEAIPAKDYVPAFFASASFPYFTLTDGSSVKLTYNVAQNLPAYLDEAAAAQQYTVSEDDYMNMVWESDEDYLEGFSPSKPASKFLPAILADELDANDGVYAVVTYKEAAQDPVFGGSSEPTPGFELSSTIGSAAKGGTLQAKAIVTAICRQGYIVTDKSGSILVYMGSAFDASSVAIGQQLELDGTVGAYNKGLQLVGNVAETPLSVNIIGQQAYTYPAPKVMSGADVDQAITRTTDELAEFVQIKGKASVSGNFYNIIIDGAEKAQGSLYQGTDAQKALISDGAEVTLEGYYISISGGRYFNMVVTKVNGKAAAPARANVNAKGAKATMATTEHYALYNYNGSKWSVPANFVVVQPADYTAMGQSYKNLSKPAQYLPTFLKTNFPYAMEGDVKNVVYNYYANSATTLACDQYMFNGTEWVINNGIVSETAQFVRTGGKWMYDPCVTITLPAGRNVEISSKYYQACVNWVFENICKPLGDTDIKSGKFYVSSYGNNEYYCGTSAYQSNIDLRPDKAREQYAAGYEGMTDEQIVALEKERFMNEVMPGALATLHPDAKPIDGIDVIYTINFAVYTGSTAEYTARFKVVAPGKFEPIDCTWDAK